MCTQFSAFSVIIVNWAIITVQKQSSAFRKRIFITTFSVNTLFYIVAVATVIMASKRGFFYDFNILFMTFLFVIVGFSALYFGRKLWIQIDQLAKNAEGSVRETNNWFKIKHFPFPLFLFLFPFLIHFISTST